MKQKAKLIKDISASGLQTLTTQVFGLVLFYVISKFCGKNDFGELNWSMAVGSTLIAISTLGLDLILVKRVAAGKNSKQVSGIHLLHTLFTGVVLSAFVFLLQKLNPSMGQKHPLFFLVFINLAIANVANSYKLSLSGLEGFKQLAILSLISNVIKLLLIVLIYWMNDFTIYNVVLIYLCTSVIELLLGYYFLTIQLAYQSKPVWHMLEYKRLVIESLPQLGVVIFDSALARIDWILLGVLSTAIATAEYSFAYKVFELSKLPLLMIAPVLLTRFSKLFGQDHGLSKKHQEELAFYLKMELFVLMIIPVMLIPAWAPLIDYFTDNKYGAVNELTFCILAACIPLHGIINFLWTLGFVQNQLKSIMAITIIVSVINVLGNLILIPLYQSLGAAFAFLGSTLVQLVLFIKFIKRGQVKIGFNNMLLSIANAVFAIVLAKLIGHSVLFEVLESLLVYLALALLTRQLEVKKIKTILLQQSN